MRLQTDLCARLRFKLKLLRVNSYGYPNPFIQESKAQEAWLTFKSFYDRDNGAYTSLKEFWETHRPRKLDSHSLHSIHSTASSSII